MRRQPGRRPEAYSRSSRPAFPQTATVSVQIADRKDLVPLYAGPAPTVAGVQQVNIAVPGDLAASATQIVICADIGGQQYCSSGSLLTIQ